MAEGNIKTIQKEFKKIGTSFKKKRSRYELATPSFRLIEHILVNLLKEQLTEEDPNKKKPGLGKLTGLARKNKALPDGLLTRLDGANKIRNEKTAHGSEELLPLTKKEAEEVYFTLAELVGRTDSKAKLDFVCNACYAGWSRRGSNLCDKCYKERKGIEDTIKKIREKTNEKIKEIRELHKMFSPIKIEKIKNIEDKQFGIPMEELEETGRPVLYTKYGKNVYGKPNIYYRQNKILDELYCKLKNKIIEGLQKDVAEDIESSMIYEAALLLSDGEEWSQGIYTTEDPEFVETTFFEKPREEFKEIESLLNKKLLKRFKSSWFNEQDTNLLDIFIGLEIFFLISTYHLQLRAKVAMLRGEMERNNFLRYHSICTKEDFSKFLGEVSRIQ